MTGLSYALGHTVRSSVVCFPLFLVLALCGDSTGLSTLFKNRCITEPLVLSFSSLSLAWDGASGRCFCTFNTSCQHSMQSATQCAIYGRTLVTHNFVLSRACRFVLSFRLSNIFAGIICYVPNSFKSYSFFFSSLFPPSSGLLTTAIHTHCSKLSKTTLSCLWAV